MTDAQNDTNDNDAKTQADNAKAEGNALYKKRQFDEAIAAYNKAWELHKDITYLNNRAAAEYEKVIMMLLLLHVKRPLMKVET